MRIEFNLKDREYKKYRSAVKMAARAVLVAEGLPRFKKSVSVLLTDDEGIRELNRDFRELDRPTDVLSFPSGEEDFLGDIAISVPRAIAQAEEYAQSDRREIAFLTVHSMLHLLGYDHIEEKEEAKMRERQRVAIKLIYG